MKLIIDDQFREICRRIVLTFDSDGEASLRWSDDEYQSRNVCGGWDDETQAFAFSFYAPDGGDYIFRMSLDEARGVAAGERFDPVLTYWKRAPPLSDE